MIALELCRNIPAEEVQQVFFCTSGREGSLAQEFLSAGASVIPMGLRPWPTLVRRMRNALRDHPADVLVSHVSLASGWLLGIGWLAGVKVRIARIHSDGDDRDNGAIRRVYRAVSRFVLAVTATHVVAVTQSSLEFATGPFAKLYEFLRGKALVVPNGIDAAKFQPTGTALSSPSTLLYVGRASPEKNRKLLMPIWRALTASGHEGEFAIVGSSRTDDLMSDIPESVKILGDRSDVNALMRDSSALILTSTREGLPTVVLEALASGLPVVASDLPGLRELQRSVTGLSLVPVNAGVDDWARQVAESSASSAAQRADIRAKFMKSPFTLEHNTLIWRQLWKA